MRQAWNVWVLLLLANAVTAPAQDAGQPIAIHGFGSSAYGKTDGNRYLVGNQEGAFRDSAFALSISAEASDRLRISSQLFLADRDGEVEASIDFAFAEWSLADTLKLRAGRVKLPFGLYTEIFDVGTLRPFATLPQGVYGPAAIVAEGYQGFGLTGRSRLGEDWTLAFDVYGGGLELEGKEVTGAEDRNESLRDTVGGRIALEAPIQGLSLGASAYSGREGSERHSAYGVDVQYLAEPWAARGEYVRLVSDEDARARAFYLELARRFGAHWQAAGRYDWSDTEAPGVALDPSLGEHRDAALGISYWIAPGFVLKLSYHRVHGNRFARAEEDAEGGIESALKARTDLVIVAAQFSF